MVVVLKKMVQRWGSIGNAIASFLIMWKMIRIYFPASLLRRWTKNASIFFNPYVHISIDEYIKRNMKPHAAYAMVEAYLSSTKSMKEAKRLKAEMVAGADKMALCMDESQQVNDEFRGAKVQWVSRKLNNPPLKEHFSDHAENRRYYTLTFHKKYRDLITGSYLDHVINAGKEIRTRYNKKQRLYTNGNKKTPWSHIVFDHPASFEKLAMDPGKKEEIVEDLIAFKEGRDFYARVGKAWKRGYLLYGPPGTGKSTLIAAMANLLHYDVYDLELTSVSDNTELRQLLVETTSKSIVVIEDVDCSLDLTGNRKKKLVEKTEGNTERSKKDSHSKGSGGSSSRVTLSGLLNFIDGLWSSCTGERIIVFTTNHVDNLDPALTRRGRMDKHIELSYCTFEGFKVLARNYLELEDHPMFQSIKMLMKETKITPADVAENLMHKPCIEAAERCLQNLVATLEQDKEKMKSDQGKEEIEENEPIKEDKLLEK